MAKYRFLISGGGTGGHIFPALSIANALRRRYDCDILFVGADNRMEMERVPAAGYDIVGLPIAGFDRKNPLRNIKVLYKLWRSMRQASKIVRDFRPDIAIGVGGYASGAALKAAQKAGVPTLIQEQNSYAGVTNKLLAKNADCICVAYPGMERFFPADKLVMTGNPVRKELADKAYDKGAARRQFGLDADKPTLLVTGGSLGALTINEALESGIKKLADKGIQVIWQTGKRFGNRGQEAAKGLSGVWVDNFITDMGAAYAAADLVVARAGASTISELELLGKAAILVPSPNVAEDHQTKNALALSERNAARLIRDDEARAKLTDAIIELMGQPDQLKKIGEECHKLAEDRSDERIVDHINAIITKDDK